VVDDTKGFYQTVDYAGDGSVRDLVSCFNNISGPGFELFFDIPEASSYPAGGWYWFDSETDARLFFDIPFSGPQLP
jgi:hypothetical protein